jgi:SAM-dependent methyltransferase
MPDGTNLDWERRAEDFAARAIADGRPTAWFDQIYAAGRRGEVSLPWDLGPPNPLLVEWATSERVRGAGRSAVVVGAGLGRDAEFVGSLGFDTVAFDVSETAVALVRDRYPDSPVRYTVADLLELPAELTHAFDLVVESYTVQALPVTVRPQAVRNVARLVGPGGMLLAIAGVREDADPVRDAPPWPLTRAEIDSFATDGLVPFELRMVDTTSKRWLATLRRPA